MQDPSGATNDFQLINKVNSDILLSMAQDGSTVFVCNQTFELCSVLEVIGDVTTIKRACSGGQIGYPDGSLGCGNLQGNLIAHWPMRDAQGTRVMDISGNGWHTTLTAASWAVGSPSDNSALLLTGTPYAAYDFSGTDRVGSYDWNTEGTVCGDKSRKSVDANIPSGRILGEVRLFNSLVHNSGQGMTLPR